MMPSHWEIGTVGVLSLDLSQMDTSTLLALHRRFVATRPGPEVLSVKAAVQRWSDAADKIEREVNLRFPTPVLHPTPLPPPGDEDSE